MLYKSHQTSHDKIFNHYTSNGYTYMRYHINLYYDFKFIYSYELKFTETAAQRSTISRPDPRLV